MWFRSDGYPIASLVPTVGGGEEVLLILQIPSTVSYPGYAASGHQTWVVTTTTKALRERVIQVYHALLDDLQQQAQTWWAANGPEWADPAPTIAGWDLAMEPPLVSGPRRYEWE